MFAKPGEHCEYRVLGFGDMKQNLGRLDRIFRFVLAIWWLGPFAPVFFARWANWLIFFIGWIALIESFIGWCGLHDWLGINNKNQ